MSQSTISMPQVEKRANRGRLQLVLMTVLFLSPVVAAWVVWQYVGEHGVGATVNKGSLVTPARPLADLPLLDLDGQPVAQGLWRGRWTFVIFAPASCEQACKQTLFDTRQVRTSVNKDIGRVQRLLVSGVDIDAAEQSWLSREHADLIAVVAAGARWEQATAEFADLAPVSADHVFLVDPLGNLMMFYGADVPASGMLKDLRKLLKISQVG